MEKISVVSLNFPIFLKDQTGMFLKLKDESEYTKVYVSQKPFIYHLSNLPSGPEETRKLINTCIPATEKEFNDALSQFAALGVKISRKAA